MSDIEIARSNFPTVVGDPQLKKFKNVPQYVHIETGCSTKEDRHYCFLARSKWHHDHHEYYSAPTLNEWIVVISPYTSNIDAQAVAEGWMPIPPMYNQMATSWMFRVPKRTR